jgi:hypothetical protein
LALFEKRSPANQGLALRKYFAAGRIRQVGLKHLQQYFITLAGADFKPGNKWTIPQRADSFPSFANNPVAGCSISWFSVPAGALRAF